MVPSDNVAIVSGYFTQAEPRLERLAARLVADGAAAVNEARAIYARMIPDLAYGDKPEHPLAPALFVCCVNLALYLALAARGVDVHRFGDALLSGLERANIPAPRETEAGREARKQAFFAAAERSQLSPAPGEDVFEALEGDGETYDFGLNVRSCAICHVFGKHDAMALVPYMCAVDDVMSAKHDQGLRRTSSIALGADHCDFRYQRGGEPRPLAPRFADRIRRAPQ